MKFIKNIKSNFISWLEKLEKQTEENAIICNSPEEIYSAMMAGVEIHQIKYEEKRKI